MARVQCTLGRSLIAAWKTQRILVCFTIVCCGTVAAEETQTISFSQFLENATRNLADEAIRDDLQPETQHVALPPSQPVPPVAVSDSPDASTSSPADPMPLRSTDVSGRSAEPVRSLSLASVPGDDVAHWWEDSAFETLLTQQGFAAGQIALDLPTVLTDTLETSPRISSVSRRTSIAYEKIIQQNAVFDPTLLLEGGYGRVNDPVGNTLTTGGPDRLIQNSVIANGGFRKLTRRGTQIDLSQELGTLDSNSLFFEPNPQGNSRLSLSITQPLMATSGEVYNTRLVTQACIESRVAWQEMRSEVESHLVETFQAFWRLYERRCQLVQQRDLIRRGEMIAEIVHARADLDSGPLQRIKVQRRLTGDRDRLIELEAEVRRLQVQLRTLVGSPAMTGLSQSVELIPLANPDLPSDDIALHDAIVRGLENRPDIQAATEELASAGLSIRITRNELKPQLDAVFDAYLAGLRGDNRFFQAFGDQFSAGGPGLSATLQYSMPYGRRAARSRVREAQYLYQQRSEELRVRLLQARREIESALIQSEASFRLRQSKEQTLRAAVREEEIATKRWELLAGDGGPATLVLEDLLETQKRRTESEQLYVTCQVASILSLIELQKAMGTLLMTEGIEPVRSGRSSVIELQQTAPMNWTHQPTQRLIDPSEISLDESLIGNAGMIEIDAENTSPLESQPQGN